MKTNKIKKLFTDDSTLFITGLIILMLCVYTTISLLSFFFTGSVDQSKIEGISFFHWGEIDGVANWTGTRGAILSNMLMNRWFGVSTFFILIYILLIALRLMKVKYVNLLKAFILYSVLTIWSSLVLAFFLGGFFKDTVIYIGGGHGFALSELLKRNFGIPGTFMIIIVLSVLVMTFVTSKTIPFLRKFFKIKSRPSDAGRLPKEKKEEIEVVIIPEPEPKPESKKRSFWSFGKKKTEKTDDKQDIQENQNEQDSPQTQDLRSNRRNRNNLDEGFEVVVPVDEEFIVSAVEKPHSFTPPLKEEIDDESSRLVEELGFYDPKFDLSSYKTPPLDLLKKYGQGDTQVDMAEQNDNKNRIIQTLKNYGVEIKSIKATVGPTVTLYEIVPEDGIKISKIRNLEDDIAMNLAALGIRIIAPMPGKGTVGIEVPNKDPQIVSMHSILASRKYQESTLELPLALGKTITNDVFMVDLAKLPHLLVAGATGQGKSVGLNAAITSLLYKKHPAELKFVLIDPKMVEFSIYSAIEKHFLAKLPDAEKPIITDFTKVIYTLNSLTKEMDDRYELLEKAGSRNVKEYNDKFISRRLNPMKGHRYMPYIVVIIDEFGDLIMTAGKEIEQPIARIAQKARAVGIHMIIATQRPTTNIITGTIKANFPARIAFKVMAMVDSRTILDGSGANQLVGRGDLLFTQGSDMTRVQCAFVDTPEVEQISRFVSNQQAYPTAYILPEYSDNEDEDKPGAVDLSNLDPLFDEAARLIVIHQQGSTSLIQRKFAIGYNRAGRLMDQLQVAGIVGPTQGSKPRDVYVQDEYNLEKILNSLK
ncbi:DNA translocase FtsK [Bacteroidia bacterium]|nr:DNA translocase FtsK [Bacteroidia bacterium]